MAVAAPLNNVNRQASPESAQQDSATFLTFSVQQREDDAQAYYEEFYQWNGRNCCRSTWKCLMDFVIAPILSAAVFVLGCTLLLPYSIYLAATRQQQRVSMQQSETVRQFMEEEPANSQAYRWQVRIRAQQIDENTKGTFRHCLDIACPLLWPLTGVCLLVDKVNAWLHGRIRPEEVYLHQQTFPSTQHEREFFDRLDENRTGRTLRLFNSSSARRWSLPSEVEIDNA